MVFAVIIPKNRFMKTRTIIFLIPLWLLLFASSNGYAQKIYSTDSQYDADVTVYVTDSKYDADLLVYKVSSQYEADGNEGLWFFTESKYDADKKIYFTDSKYAADLIIYFTDSKYDAGWKNRQKIYLLY
jgi:hypothetical protein